MKEKIKKILQIIINIIYWAWIIFAFFCFSLFSGILIYNLFTKSLTINAVFIQFGNMSIYLIGFSIFIYMIKQSINSIFTESFHMKLLHAFFYIIFLIIFLYFYQCLFSLM